MELGQQEEMETDTIALEVELQQEETTSLEKEDGRRVVVAVVENLNNFVSNE